MRAELRADGLHISGYVNIPGRESRPVETPRYSVRLPPLGKGGDLKVTLVYPVRHHLDFVELVHARKGTWFHQDSI